MFAKLCKWLNPQSENDTEEFQTEEQKHAKEIYELQTQINEMQDDFSRVTRAMAERERRQDAHMKKLRDFITGIIVLTNSNVTVTGEIMTTVSFDDSITLHLKSMEDGGMHGYIEHEREPTDDELAEIEEMQARVDSDAE